VIVDGGVGVEDIVNRWEKRPVPHRTSRQPLDHDNRDTTPGSLSKGGPR
jgi:hypothetical protein